MQANIDVYNINFIYCWLQAIMLWLCSNSYLRNCLFRKIDQSRQCWLLLGSRSSLAQQPSGCSLYKLSLLLFRFFSNDLITKPSSAKRLYVIIILILCYIFLLYLLHLDQLLVFTQNKLRKLLSTTALQDSWEISINSWQ